MEQQDKLRLLGRMRLYKGHKIYKCNLVTGDLSVMDLDLSMGGNIMREKDYFYLTALNLKNAKRKAKKWLGIEIKFKK